ncbi:MAG: DUF3990 domain-containing protein [Bacteroidales bacterium]|nr:DUF3990 domain-containing protein [Bacteroidales bacterium]
MNAQIELYHGSPIVMEHPFLGGGKRWNDYGSGFYCTESTELAFEWARPGTEPGFANKYVLDTAGLTTLYLNRKPYHILNWLAILLQNRKFALPMGIANDARDYVLAEFLPEYEGYDLIVGYRADDSYFSFAKAFLHGGISLEQLSSAMKLGNPGEQVVLKSEKAFEQLLFLGAAPVPDIYATRRKARDDAARESFYQTRESPFGGILISDIIREKWKNDDARLQ